MQKIDSKTLGRSNQVNRSRETIQDAGLDGYNSDGRSSGKKNSGFNLNDSNSKKRYMSPDPKREAKL